MKSSSIKMISRYEKAIINVIKDQHSFCQIILDLNAFLIIFHKYKLESFYSGKKSELQNVINSIKIHNISKNIINTILKKRRIDILEFLLKRLSNVYSVNYNVNVVVVSSSVMTDYDMICKMDNFKNCLILFRQEKNTKLLNIKINDLVLNFNLDSRINKIKRDFAKNILNLLV